MKKLQRLCAATTLVLVLSLSVVAGDISTNVVSPPPSPPASSLAAEPSDVSAPSGEMQAVPGDFVTEITLSLFQLLSVF